MANIDEHVRKIRSSIYGRDVRESIAAGMEAMNQENENASGRVTNFLQESGQTFNEQIAEYTEQFNQFVEERDSEFTTQLGKRIVVTDADPGVGSAAEENTFTFVYEVSYVSHDGFCGRGLTGAVVGMNKSGGSVSNCHVRGVLYHMYGYGGGVAYQNDGRVECCYFYASVTKGVSDNFQEFGSLVHTNTGTLRNIIVASPPTGTFYTFPNWKFWVNNSGTGGGTITHINSNKLSASTFQNFDLETIWLFSGGDMKLRAFC